MSRKTLADKATTRPLQKQILSLSNCPDIEIEVESDSFSLICSLDSSLEAAWEIVPPPAQRMIANTWTRKCDELGSGTCCAIVLVSDTWENPVWELESNVFPWSRWCFPADQWPAKAEDQEKLCVEFFAYLISICALPQSNIITADNFFSLDFHTDVATAWITGFTSTDLIDELQQIDAAIHELRNAKLAFSPRA